MPHFIKKEFEKLQESLEPTVRKASKYGLWAFPLILLSLFNFVSLLFFASARSTIVIVIYAIIGAVGLALYKEAKFQRKAIRTVSFNYIIKRISESEVAPESLKKKYLSQIKNQPAMTFNYFIGFLEEENRAYNYNN